MRRCFCVAIPLAAPLGCAQTVNVEGVYVPGWLIAITVGVIVSYAAANLLVRQPRYRALGQSGLLFLSLSTSVAFVVWWAFFSRVGV